jgi:hypothetical protein
MRASALSHVLREGHAYWNYKSALLSAAFRGAIFLAANLSAGWDAALGAFLAECVFRVCTAGFYGALTQRIGQIEPERRAMLVAMVVLPVIAHTLEFLVHWTRGTVNLRLSIAFSMAFTILSTAFNVFAMRRGVLRSGPGSRSIFDDLRHLPRLMRELVA